MNYAAKYIKLSSDSDKRRNADATAAPLASNQKICEVQSQLKLPNHQHSYCSRLTRIEINSCTILDQFCALLIKISYKPFAGRRLPSLHDSAIIQQLFGRRHL